MREGQKNWDCSVWREEFSLTPTNISLKDVKKRKVLSSVTPGDWRRKPKHNKFHLDIGKNLA